MLLSRAEIGEMPEQASCGSFQDDSWAPERIAATLKEQAEVIDALERFAEVANEWDCLCHALPEDEQCLSCLAEPALARAKALRGEVR